MTRNQFFDSQWPIVEAVMNQGSSLELAIAVHKAGGFPSLWMDWTNFAQCQEILKKFIDVVGKASVMIPLSRHKLCQPDIIEFISDMRVSHCEVFSSNLQGEFDDLYQWLDSPQVSSAVRLLKRTSRVLLRIYDIMPADRYSWFDGFTIKGKESAGKTGNWSVQDLFLAQMSRYPGSNLVPMGGVGHPDQVKWYMDHGAVGVGVGTVLAVSQESPLTTEVKQKVLGIQKPQLVQNTKQNCVLFGDLPSTQEQDWNRTQSLTDGINGNGSSGHLYLGHSISHVDRIKPVQEIISHLVSTL
jgi:hypothetical protein